jgi:hypothetical protein
MSEAITQFKTTTHLIECKRLASQSHNLPDCRVGLFYSFAGVSKIFTSKNQDIYEFKYFINKYLQFRKV